MKKINIRVIIIFVMLTNVVGFFFFLAHKNVVEFIWVFGVKCILKTNPIALNGPRCGSGLKSFRI